MSHMLVVGSVAFDTLHIGGKAHSKVLGGSAVYAALAASHFAPVQLVGVVGRDFPDDAIGLLRSHKVDLAGLEVVDGETFHWEGRYADDLSSRETIRTDLNVFADFSPKIPAACRDARYVMLGNIDPVLQMQVLDQIERPALVIADTMNLWIDIKRPELVALLKRVDVLVVNDEEARQLSKVNNLVKAAGIMQEMGPRTVIIKKGEHGAMLFDGEDLFCLPALPLLDVVDPTGAGDTFAGALLGYLAGKNDHSALSLRKAVVCGSVVASFCVAGVGPSRLAAVSTHDVRQRFGQFHRLVNFHADALD